MSLPRVSLRIPRLATPARVRRPNRLLRRTAAKAGTVSTDWGRNGSRKAVKKIGKHWLNKPDVLIRGEREICNPATAEGQAEYKWRVLLMWIRQEGLCCNCREPLSLREATFEHEDGRTKARRDDRIALFDEDGRFIRHLNGASHMTCNSRRGSRRTEIFHGNNAFIDLKGVAA